MTNGYSSDSTQRELSNEYQDDRVKMIFIILHESDLSSRSAKSSMSVMARDWKSHFRSSIAEL